MKKKENLISLNKKDVDSNSNSNANYKLPSDMRLFWREINKNYFSDLNPKQVKEVNHLIQLHSRYNIRNDQIYNEVGFPRSLSKCLMERPMELHSVRSNPVYTAKILGTYVYLDTYDYEVNNLNNKFINEEINLLEQKITEMEESNVLYFEQLKKKINQQQENQTVDLTDKHFLNLRLFNLTNQIFKLQMEEFAESVSTIKKDINSDKYVLFFDPTENIKPIVIPEKEYREFISYRDPTNSFSVYDLFQQKFHTYHTTTPPNGKKLTNGKFEIAKKVSANYKFCHSCKQRKPDEINSKFPDKPLKLFYTNDTTIITRKYENYIITNFNGDAREFVESLKRKAPICNRLFCNTCLKSNYDQEIDDVKKNKEWICPFCSGNCYCTRCLRNDQILKLIALYISFKGDLDLLYTYMIEHSPISSLAKEKFVLKKIFLLTSEDLNKSNFKLSKIPMKQIKAVKHIQDISYKCLSSVEQLKDYFDSIFNKMNIERFFLNLDMKNEFPGISTSSFFLNKKTSREENNNNAKMNQIKKKKNSNCK